MVNRLLSSALMAFFLFACQPEERPDCFRSTGPIRTEKRNLAPFSKLIVRSDLDVSWHYSDSTYLMLRCGKHLMSGIQTQVTDGLLILDNHNRCRWVRSYRNPMEIELFSPSPELISLQGYGRFKTEDTLTYSPLTVQYYGASEADFWVNLNELFLDFAGQNLCRINGKTVNAIIAIQKPGRMDARNLRIQNLGLFMKGENEAWVQASDSLWGEHQSNTTVWLRGNPKTSIKETGKGRIKSW